LLKWKTCPVSQKPLKAPIVSDALGNLYNKVAIIEFLLPSDDPATEACKPDQEKVLGGRVKGLKDIVEVKFQEDEEAAERKSTDWTSGWVCPITGKGLGPAVKTAYIVPCGHAFSEVALKEVSGDVCLQCNEPYTVENMVTILPLAESDKARLAKRMELLKEQGLTHSLKKASGLSKKRKKNAELKIEETSAIKLSVDKPKESAKVVGIKNAATASLTAKVLAEEQEKAKRRKLDPNNDNLKSLFSSGNKAHKDGDFMTRGFSIPTGARR